MSEYKKGFLYILSSKVLIAFISFLVTPVLSRLYQPQDYGYFGLINSSILVLGMISGLTLPTCLLISKNEDLQKNIAGILGYSILTNFIFLTIGIVWFFISDNAFLSLPLISLICLSSFLTTATQIFANLNIRDKSFKKNVSVNLLDNFSTRASSLAFGFGGLTKYGLLLGESIGKLVNLIRQLWPSERRMTFPFNVTLKISEILSVIRRNRSYPLFYFPTMLIGSFSGQLIIWILALYFSASSVGYFTMSIGLLSVPLILLSNSLQPLITSKFILESAKDLRKLFWRAASTIALLSALFYLTIFAVAPFFVKIYLSESWLASGSMIQILCIPFSLQLLGNSMNGLFIVYNKQLANFIFKLIFLFLLISGLFLLIKIKAELTTVVIWYSVIVSLEELTKLSYLALKLNYVRSR